MTSLLSGSDAEPWVLHATGLADRHRIAAYAIGGGLAIGSLIVNYLLRDALAGNMSFVPLAALMVAAIALGYEPALFALFLSLLGLECLFWLPRHSAFNSIFVGTAYGLVGIMIVYVAASMRRLNARNCLNAEQLKLAIEDRNEMLSVISQDFRTHLDSLRLNQGVLRVLTKSTNSKTDVDIARRFQVADREISQLTGLIDNVLAISKGHAGRQLVDRVEFDLSELVQEIADSLSIHAEEANCRFSLDLHPAVGKWDRRRLERVVITLLGNAIKYAPGSDIAVQTGTVDGHARLSIRDQGPGIPSDKLDALFQHPFEYRQDSDENTASNIGMYVAKTIVDSHGGRLTAQSHAGQGSVFTVELPLR